MSNRTYIAIDLKSFYASVECRERNKDPLDYLLAVADESRTDKTICLAVSAPMKSIGIPGRPRLFEVKEIVREVNARRKERAPQRRLWGKTRSLKELEGNPSLALDFETAMPRMGLYIEYSRKIYGIYLRHCAPDDIHVYSIDEVFIDATDYLKLYKMDARSFAMTLIKDVLGETGITATAGIGTNLYLAKVAMDIMAKHTEPDKDGVRIASLDESEYRKELWKHTPITDFWRVGHGYERRLRSLRLYTMADIAACSIGSDSEYHNEDLLYRTFGKNAELLIDHAWGQENCTMKDIKGYKAKARSISAGQVLQRPYENEEALTVLKEMADSLSLDLVSQGLYTAQLALYIGYDVENMKDEKRAKAIMNGTRVDFYGRELPKHDGGTIRLKEPTCLSKPIREAFACLFRITVNPALLIKRINIAACDVRTAWKEEDLQLDLFVDYEKLREEKEEERIREEKEKSLLETAIGLKGRFGKNAILRGISYMDGSTQRERNLQIGGHRA